MRRIDTMPPREACRRMLLQWRKLQRELRDRAEGREPAMSAPRAAASCLTDLPPGIRVDLTPLARGGSIPIPAH